ncbi:MAG: hypothetical protein F6J92_32315 [Symploca sp. SIO1A3]|nr:hypothetical protein [Symploca sp. SIO1A3]
MDPYQQRKHDLDDNIKNCLILQKKYEDELLLEDDPGQIAKLEAKLAKIKENIANYQTELNDLVGGKIEEDSLTRAMTAITFRELEMVTQGILCMPLPTDTNFIVLPPQQKILKNELTGAVQTRLMTGAIQARMVGHFVENMVNLIPDFPERLKAGFEQEYQRLRERGIVGDALFFALQEFSCNRSSDYDLQAAGIAVLYYLFEKCEVFER